MILYLDTSALLKLYADEPGRRRVLAAVDDAEVVASHLVAYAEARAALAHKHRLGDISNAQLAEHKRELDSDWQALYRVSVTEALVRRAGDLSEQHALRGYDSVHLAAAEQLGAAIDAPIVFGCFDVALANAASALGLDLL